MRTTLQLPIFLILISLVLNIDFIFQNVELNDKTENVKVIITTGAVDGLRIYTKIETSSKIEVEIISEKQINQTQMFYDRAKKVGGTIKKSDHPTCTRKGKTSYCVYSVKKEDDYEYGGLLITDLPVGKEIFVTVRVFSETAVWVIVVIVILVLIVVLVGLFVVCKYFYRCICCKK